MTKEPSHRPRIFGVDIDNLTVDETVGAIFRLVTTGHAHSVVTVNLDHILKLRTDTAFQQAYQAASLCVADGAPFVLMSKIDGEPLKERVAGSDLIEPVCAHAAQTGQSVYFLGSTEERLATAKAALTQRHPMLRVVGCHAPPMGFATNETAQLEALDNIRQAQPDIIMVALGAPRQEIFSARATRELDHGVFLNIGAGLDFFSGEVRRAPQWMQKTGTEWLYRALSEPARLGPRYGQILLALPGLIKQHYAARKNRAA